MQPPMIFSVHTKSHRKRTNLSAGHRTDYEERRAFGGPHKMRKCKILNSSQPFCHLGFFQRVHALNFYPLFVLFVLECFVACGRRIIIMKTLHVQRRTWMRSWGQKRAVFRHPPFLQPLERWTIYTTCLLPLCVCAVCWSALLRCFTLFQAGCWYAA